MKMRITADDLGLTKGINYGIYDSCKDGVVNAVSLLMNMKQTSHGYDLIKGLDVHIGVHLNLTIGKPLGDVPELMEYGFFKPDNDYEKHISIIEKEFTLQIEKALDLGITIAHLSTYDDIQFKYPIINELLYKLGSKYQIPVRNEKPFTDVFHGKMAQLDTFMQILIQDTESIEVRVQPGYLDGPLIDLSEYREMRVVEQSILVSPFLKSLLEEKKVMMY